ncbi:hypothetical protein SDC9_146949 [bioreactor metagenome]|uniref:Uncharacterized protein n=1 Tax=bioreactor metagenome TaxID=1076179 RepID=A0A645EEA9_9ZZZZ
MERVKLFALADIAGDGDDFVIIIFLEPRDYNRRIESARIGQYNLFFSHNIIHLCKNFY